MTKQKLIPVLSILLVLQLALAAGLHWYGSTVQASTPGEKLLAVDFSQIDQLRIENGESAVTLRKVNQEWQVPELEFPASQDKVTGFLDKLANLEKGWPVATTSDAAKRFKVNTDQFERKISLKQGEETLAVLYLGTSPTYRNANLRVDGEDEIYTGELSSYDAAVKPDEWIDKEILQVETGDIQRIALDNFVLAKQDGKWILQGLKDDEQSNAQEIQSLVSKIANLRINGVLGKEAKPEYGLDKPDHMLTLDLAGDKQRVYRLAKPENESYFVLKSSTLEQYLQVPVYTINPIVDTKREKLVEAKKSESEEGTETQNTG